MKKNRKFLITSMICIAIVLIASGTIINYKSKKNLNTDSKKEPSINSVKITGNSILAEEYNNDGDNKLVYNTYIYPYLEYSSAKENKTKILNADGKVLFTLDGDSSKHEIHYIGDGYFASTENKNDGYETIKIIDYKGNQKTFKIGFYSTFYYQDGILYYSYSKSKDKMTNYSTRAYDLKKDKILWDVNGTNPFVLENGKIVLQKDNNVGDYVNDDIVVDKNSGKTLVKANKDDEKLYTTESCYYRVTKSKVEVYDYDNNKLSSFDLVNNDKYQYSLVEILSTGGFVINIYQKDNYNSEQYKVYNKKGKEILSIKGKKMKANSIYTYVFDGGISTKNSSPKYSILTDKTGAYEPSYIIFDDDTIEKIYDVERFKNYVVGYEKKGRDTPKIINLTTKKVSTIKEKLITTYIESPKNNTYFAIHNYDFKHTGIYDGELNKIYETTNSIKAVNDEYFLETDYKGEKSIYYLVNVKTLEKNKLTTNGAYSFSTENNLVTHTFDGKKQFLYKFK